MNYSAPARIFIGFRGPSQPVAESVHCGEPSFAPGPATSAREALARRLEHAIELSRLFPDARLLVLPGGHGDYMTEASSAPTDTDYAVITAPLVERFLDVTP